MGGIAGGKKCEKIGRMGGGGREAEVGKIVPSSRTSTTAIVGFVAASCSARSSLATAAAGSRWRVATVGIVRRTWLARRMVIERRRT